ncbi:hypothetical protein DIPPA_34685 [Diplonema papillatum]|nr:hypothetical protein DIPPA_34685 [Diplonema papillatum]
MRWQIIACLLAGVPQGSAQASVDYRITTGNFTGAGSIDTFSLYFHTYSVATVVGTITNPGEGDVIEDTADFPEIDDFAYASLVYSGTNNDDWSVLTLELKLGGVWKNLTAPDASHQPGGHVVIYSGHVDAEFFDMNDDKTPVNTIATKFTTSNVAWAETSNIIVIFFHSETDVHYAGVIYDSPKEKVWDIVAKDCPFPLADLVSVTAKAIRADNDGYHLAKVELQQADGTFTSLYGQNWQGTSGWINHVQASWMPVPVDSVVLTLHKVLLRIATYTDADSGSADTFSIYMNSYNDSVVVATKTSPAVGEVAYFNFEFDRFFDIAYVSLVYAGTNNDDWRVSHVEVFMYGRWENFTCPDALEERKAGRPEVSTINAAHLDSEWFDLTGTKPTVNSITTKWTTDDVQFSGSSNIITIFFHSETEVHYAGVIYDAELGSEWDITATDCPFPVSQLLMVTARALRAANDGYIVKTVELSENGGFTLLWGLTFNGYGGWINHVQPGWAQNPMDEAVFGRTNGMLRITTGSDPAAGSDDDFSIYMHSYHEAGLVATKSSSSPGEVAIVPFNYDGMDKLALVSLVYNGTANDDWQVAAVDLYTVAGWVSLSAPDVPAGGVAHIEVGHIDSEWFDMRPRSSVNTITTKWFTSTAASSESDNLFIIFYHSDLEVHYAGSVADPTNGQEVTVTATDCPFPLSELRMVTVRALRSEASDGWILEKVELEQADGSFSTMYGQTWESSGGWVNHQQPSWMPDPLDEVVLTPKKLLFRITTNGAADSGSADSFAMNIHSYHEVVRAATVAAPASGNATLVNVDFVSEVPLSYVSLVYEGTANDEWQVKSVEYYKKGGWKLLTCPDALQSGDGFARINSGHIDSEWFDMHPKAAANTIKTLWVTKSNDVFAGSTNIIVVHFHSATQAHYAGVIYDPSEGSVWVIEAVDCPFPLADLKMVTANALREGQGAGASGDGFVVEKVEILLGTGYQKMWGQPWNAYGGWITHHKPGWMADPTDEVVLTVNENPFLMRIRTSLDDASAGSAEKFSVYLHSYRTSKMVATVDSPTVGAVALFDFEFTDGVASLSHISIVLDGTNDDDWWIAAVEVYEGNDWKSLSSPDQIESVKAGGPNASIITAAHIDSEWFDMTERPVVNEVSTKWTTATIDFADSTNIVVIFYHSESTVHYAGVIHDAKKGEAWDITAKDCPFPVSDLRMVTARALRAPNDGYILEKVELKKADGTYVPMWGQTWEDAGGWINHEQPSWMADAVDEVVFTELATDMLLRVTTASATGAGSNDTFGLYLHTHEASTKVAEKVTPAAGEVSIFNIDFAEFRELAHVSLVYEGTRNDDWRVESVEVYRNKAWHAMFSPDSANGPEPITKDHVDSEWFDITPKPMVNVITTLWHTADVLYADSTNIITIFFHSSSQAHYAGVIYDPKRADTWNITAVDCPFPLADLRMVTARALRAAGDGYIVDSVELLQSDGTLLKLWSVHWQAYGGWIIHEKPSWMPDPLDEVIFTMSKVLLRISTNPAAGAGCAGNFSVYMHTYAEAALVATVDGPSDGEVLLLNLDFDGIDELTRISIVYSEVATVTDDWQVDSVQLYTKDGWRNYTSPTTAALTPSDSTKHWIDTLEDVQRNTVTTTWTSGSTDWADTTNVFGVYYHSQDQVHFAGTIYNPVQSGVVEVTTVDCPFPMEGLLMVTIKPLQASENGYLVEKVELSDDSGAAPVTMYGQTFQGAGGLVGTDPAGEWVFTPKEALLRVTTHTAAGAGSADSFLVYMHTYAEDNRVGAIAAPAAGSVVVLNVEFTDVVNELAHVSLVYDGTRNDDWQVALVEAYMDGRWQNLSCPDAWEAGVNGLPAVSTITADHIDSEWFNEGPRPLVNTITTMWTTSSEQHADSTNIVTIFYHSATQAHYAGVIYDADQGSIWNITATNCPFPIEELRMVTARSLRASNDGYIVATVALVEETGYKMLWGQTWGDYGGWCSYVQADWMDGPVREVILTPKKALLRISTSPDTGAGSTDNFTVYIHSYHENILAATIAAPAAGQVQLVNVDYDFGVPSFFSLVYAGVSDDDWQVLAVEYYKPGGWKMLFAPDVEENGNGVARIYSGHVDSEWFDMHPKAGVNTIKTMWTTSSVQYAESTSIIVVYFHSKTVAHYAGVIHDAAKGSIWKIEAVDVPFPLSELQMVTANAVRSQEGDGYIVERVELMTGTKYEKLWGQPWNGFDGWIIHEKPGWMTNPSDEIVFTRKEHPFLLRVYTPDEADAGSAEQFDVYLHSYHTTEKVGTIDSPASGSVALFNFEFTDLVEDMSHVSFVGTETTADDWWVNKVEVYVAGDWRALTSPDLEESVKAGGVNASVITATHMDSEWFDLTVREVVHPITTMWSTDTVQWSETSNIITVFYHSESAVHYAGTMYDVGKGEIVDITANDCPFPVGDLKMITARALRAGNDGYIVAKVELQQEDGTLALLYSPTWQATTGWINHVQAAWMVNPLDEVVFVTNSTNQLLRVTTASEPHSGSNDTFGLYMHTYDVSTKVATKVAPAAGEASVFSVDFPAFDQLAHVSLVYEGTLNDDWRVQSVEVYKGGKWVSLFSPDAADGPEPIHAGHVDSEWFDDTPREVVNVVTTMWQTADVQYADTTNIIAIYFHSDTHVHYAGIIYDAERGSSWNITAADCPFPAADLRIVNARALRASNDGYIVEKVELVEADGSLTTLRGQNWGGAAGGWISHVQAGWMPDPLHEVYLTRSSVLLRVTTDTAPEAGSALTNFTVYMHSFHVSTLVGSVDSPAPGDVAYLNFDFEQFDDISHISLVYNDTTSDDDDWWVSKVEVYTKNGWRTYFCPDAKEAGDAGLPEVSIVTRDHPDSEWLDIVPRPGGNTVTTRWTTSSGEFAESTNIVTIFYHSATLVHYAGAIYDAERGSAWDITTTNCPFHVSELRMVTARALRASADGYIVEKVELLQDGVYTPMWGQHWKASGGWIIHEQPGWMPEPLDEVVLTPKKALMRITTDEAEDSGSVDTFYIYMHTYHEHHHVATVHQSANGSVVVMNVDFRDAIEELAHISIVYNGTNNDEWRIKSVEVYMDNRWDLLACPDAIEAGKLGQPEVSTINADHIDSEWFDMGERPMVNTITTVWTTDTAQHSESTNIITIFYHSETQVHYAGVIYDAQQGDIWNITTTNCPFNVTELRMVTARALRASNDGYVVAKVELMTAAGGVAPLWGQNWQSPSGWISYVQADWMPVSVREVSLTVEPVLLRVRTAPAPDAGSVDNFALYMHSYEQSTVIGVLNGTHPHEFAIFNVNFTDVEELSHVSLVYEGTNNDAWEVASVELHRDGEWQRLTSPDVLERGVWTATVDEAHIDSEWFDLRPRRQPAHTIKTLWVTATEEWAATTNIITVFFHSDTQTHYAGAIYDAEIGSAWNIGSTSCPFPVEDLQRVTARALRPHTDDGYSVEKVEVWINGAYRKMWGETWDNWGGWIEHKQQDWMPDRLNEIVLTVAGAEPPDVETPESDDNDTLSPTDARGAAGDGDSDDETWKILFITLLCIVACLVCVMIAFYLIRRRDERDPMKTVIFEDDYDDDGIELANTGYENHTDEDDEDDDPLRKASNLNASKMTRAPSSQRGADLADKPSTYEPPALNKDDDL